jgi:hypothetical protein
MTNKCASRDSKSESKGSSSEPLFYVGLVLKGTEDQYVNLLKYINKRNGSHIIYQCKSLTYLRVSREDSTKLKAVLAEPDELASEEVP